MQASVSEQLQLIKEEPKVKGLLVYLALSLCVHFALILYWFLHRPQQVVEQKLPTRYVELVSPTRQFTEAPGEKLPTPPRPDAAFSDANRKASAPQANGDRPTSRPGDPDRTFVPDDSRSRSSQPNAPQVAQLNRPDAVSDAQRSMSPVQASAVTPSINWNSAIRQISRPSSDDGGGESVRGSEGGENGFAADGPVSFETQWYDWGEYAEVMVRRIRNNWYDNMPELIKLGMKGVVTIRFTIERSGTISHIELLDSSTIPPFDNAARKAIELSSPLPPLPKDFPNPSERVTVQFYYNLKPKSSN